MDWGENERWRLGVTPDEPLHQVNWEEAQRGGHTHAVRMGPEQGPQAAAGSP